MGDHPVKVPPGVINDFHETALALSGLNHSGATITEKIVTAAAQWGADQELEACCEWVSGTFLHGTREANQLRVFRRPKPPTLAEQGLKALEAICSLADNDVDTIKAALYRLAELEAQ